MKRSAILAGVTLCLLPLFFSFKNTVSPAESPSSLIVRATPIENTKAIKLRMANLLKKPVRIVIEDLNGHVYYSEKVLGHNGYRQLFDLENLAPGNYILRIMHPSESKVGTLVLSARSVDVFWENESLR